MKGLTAAWLLLLAGCGSASENEIEPVPQQGSADSAQLLRKAEGAAGNARARMSFEAGNTINGVSQAETKR